jgi:hypothetical protein
MTGKFRRIAVLGVTSLGTWAVVPVAAPADDKVATPPAHVAKAAPHEARAVESPTAT